MAGVEPGSSWSFSGISTGSNPSRQPMPGSFMNDYDAQTAPPKQSQAAAEGRDGQRSRPRRSWPARQCRICLDSVEPTFAASDSAPSFFEPNARVEYVSPDPSLGRLIRPCKCRGSSRYVHEGCLQRWRHTDPSYGARNYWQCPTCGFKYRLQRVTWGRAINNTATRLALTAAVFLAAMFMLGFVADPIISLYLDPYDTITGGVTGAKRAHSPLDRLDKDDSGGWALHFVKGLASLGLLGFVKVFFALSPWQVSYSLSLNSPGAQRHGQESTGLRFRHSWMTAVPLVLSLGLMVAKLMRTSPKWFNLRNSGLLNSGGRGGTTGRDRVANISWVVIVLGVLTFLYTVWKLVTAWSRRTLEKASEVVMDVPLDDEDEEFEETDRPADQPRQN